MKKLKILFLIVFTSLSSYAQDPKLFENTWYLQKIIIDGQEIFPPINSDVDFVSLDISIDNFLTIVCDSASGPIIDINNESFDVNDFFFLDGDCFLQETFDFEGNYFNDFLLAGSPFYSFLYLIEPDSNNNLTLILTNLDGNQAIYGNEILSIQYFDNLPFEVYPNPVKDELFIASKTSINDFNIFIYSIDGKLILSVNNSKLNKNSIDIQKLTSGIYFIQIKDKQGQSTIKKFIKN